MHVHGIENPKRPILDRLQTIQQRDALVDATNPRLPVTASWPEADYIIGNPPFAGRGKKRKLLTEYFGSDYVKNLNRLYTSPLQSGSDLCCYWFEKSREAMNEQVHLRVGLLATQGIRGGTNLKVLKSIKESGDIFYAVSDR